MQKPPKGLKSKAPHPSPSVLKTCPKGSKRQLGLPTLYRFIEQDTQGDGAPHNSSNVPKRHGIQSKRTKNAVNSGSTAIVSHPSTPPSEATLLGCLPVSQNPDKKARVKSLKGLSSPPTLFRVGFEMLRESGHQTIKAVDTK